jgi:hypothetical protein
MQKAILVKLADRMSNLISFIRLGNALYLKDGRPISKNRIRIDEIAFILKPVAGDSFETRTSEGFMSNLFEDTPRK